MCRNMFSYIVVIVIVIVDSLYIHDTFLYSFLYIRYTLKLKSLVVALTVSKQLLRKCLTVWFFFYLLFLISIWNVSGTEKVVLQATVEPHLVTAHFPTANINTFSSNHLKVFCQHSLFLLPRHKIRNRSWSKYASRSEINPCIFSLCKNLSLHYPWCNWTTIRLIGDSEAEIGSGLQRSGELTSLTPQPQICFVLFLTCGLSSS